ncbi:daptide-type RiPP, partial [Streptomyces nitrosporeus]
MNEKFENTALDLDSLELGLQELEAMEAPGWW